MMIYTSLDFFGLLGGAGRGHLKKAWKPIQAYIFRFSIYIFTRIFTHSNRCCIEQTNSIHCLFHLPHMAPIAPPRYLAIAADL
jgi:hypothetical protein